MGGGGRVPGGGGVSQGRCEQRSEVFLKIPKKKIWGGGGGRVGGGGHGRCEQRNEVFVKIQKKKWGGGGGWVGGSVWMDKNG